MVDVTAPTGENAVTLVALTAPGGSFRVPFNLTKVVDRFGPGTYTVQASIFDASELDDAESNPVQITV